MNNLAKAEPDHLNYRYPQPTCTCGKPMTLSTNMVHLKPYHQCDACGSVKIQGSSLFNVWDRIDGD